MPDTALDRRRLIYHGHVQGVGFRFTSHSIACRHAVTGFVRNLNDGTVELCLSGASSEVARCLEAISERLSGNISFTEESTLDADVNLPEAFEIRR